MFISVPISYLSPWSLERVQLIDPSSISIKSMYKNEQFSVEWTQNNTILILDAVESTTPLLNAPIADYNGMQFDTSRIGLEYDLNGNNGEESNTNPGDRRRRRRSAYFESDSSDAYFNVYTQNIVEPDEINTFAWNDGTTFDRRLKRDIFTTDDKILANLPANRTIYFDCQNEEQEMCLVGKFTVSDFVMDNSPIMVTLNFSINLNRLSKFSMRHTIHFMRLRDEENNFLLFFLLQLKVIFYPKNEIFSLCARHSI